MLWLLPALTALFHLGGLWCLRGVDPGREAGWGLSAQLVAWLLAGLCWLATLALLHRMQKSPRLVYIVVLGLLMRLPALFFPTVHSGDIYRYLWDGRVQAAGLNPYAGPPDAAPYVGVKAAHPELFARINHRELPTIYPPAAQNLFRLAETPQRWRLLCAGAELVLWLLLWLSCSDRRWLTIWILSPLPAIELWLNGHLDGFGVLLLLAGLLVLRRSSGGSALPGAWVLSTGLAGALLSLSVLVKPLSLAVVPGVVQTLRGAERRRSLIGLLLAGALLSAALAWWPYRAAGLSVTPSLGEYGRRWRVNEGAYAILQGAAESAVAIAYKPPYYQPWRLPRLARLINGRGRDTVWPDELAGFLARAGAAAALLGLLAIGLRRRLPPEHQGLLLLSGYALLTPALHPWYLLWPLVLAPLWLPAALPILLLAALAPLAYLPLPVEWAGGGHHESTWVRLCEHGPAWAAVAWLFFQPRRPRAGQST